MNNGTPRLGIDIGRVIIDGTSHPTGDDTAFFKGGIDNALRTPAMTGAFESIERLSKLFDRQVWLVSKCGERVEARTRAWLEHHRFFERTVIHPDHIRFCHQRPEKAIHCVELELTHFVDDRIDVLEAIEGIVPHRYLFGPQSDAPAAGVVSCPNWPTAERAIAHATVGSDRSTTRS